MNIKESYPKTCKKKKKINSVFIAIVYLRNKSWKPESVGSFNMDWQILVYYPEPKARDKIY